MGYLLHDCGVEFGVDDVGDVGVVVDVECDDGVE